MPEGTTVRFYDLKIDTWHGIWISPNQDEVVPFMGREASEEIVLERVPAEEHRVKCILSEITDNSFRWRSEESRDDGKSWTLNEEMRIMKREV